MEQMGTLFANVEDIYEFSRSGASLAGHVQVDGWAEGALAGGGREIGCVLATPWEHMVLCPG